MKELHIKLSEWQPGSYQAKIVKPPLGAEGFDLPSNAGWPCRLELPPALADSNRTLADFQSDLLNLGQNDSSEELKAIGGDLYDFLFGPLDSQDNGNVLYEYWDNCLHQSPQVQVDGVRTVLQLDSPSLIGVPWELCNLGGDYLAMQTPHTMLRTAWRASGAFRREPVPLPSSNMREPLRMLLVISHRPDDVLVMGPDEALSVDKALFRLLPWMVDLHILIRPTFGELQEWCENWEPHILHYVGHGDATKEKSYLLLYERGKSDATPIDQADMMNLFKKRVPRLVVLNACRSGQVGSVDMSLRAARATQSFSQRLIQKGVLAVIAMQADIKGEDAVPLMSDFYRELAEGKPIDQALTFAREYSFAKGRNEGKWDWALPALYLAKGVRAEEVLHLDDIQAEPKVFPAIANNQQWLPLAMGVKIHVGREKEQLTLEKKVLACDLADIAPITLLRGVRDMGKTTMLYWLSEGCARRGRSFIYADFAWASLDYWDVLRLIRDGRLETVSGVALHNHLPLDTDLLFNTFNDALNRKTIEHYAADNLKPDSFTAVQDKAPNKNPISEMEKQGGVTIFSRVEQGVRTDEKKLYETITEEFWSGLARAAEPNGLIIFLDHIEKLFPGTVETMHKYLIDRLLTANSSSPASKVRLVLAVRDTDPTDEASLFEQSEAGKTWNFLFELAQKDGSKVRELRVEGLPHEQLHWLAQLWARRYFIYCSTATPFKEYINAFLNGRNPEPRQVDAYVKKRVDSYDPVPIAPGRLINNLLEYPYITDWLKTLKK